jgi:hypothetical protein
MTPIVWVIMFASIPATLFPLVYLFSPWWRTVPGQAIMTLSVGLALMVDSALARELLGADYPGRSVVRVLVFVFVVVGLWYLLVALLWTLHKYRRDGEHRVRQRT